MYVTVDLFLTHFINYDVSFIYFDDSIIQIMELKREGKIVRPKEAQPSTSTTPISSSSTLTPSSSLEKLRNARRQFNTQSVADKYAGKLSSKLGEKKRRMISQVVANMALKEDERRKPILGALLPIEDKYNGDDDDNDDLNDFEIKEQRKERINFSSEAASDAIEMLRRNINTSDEEDEVDLDEKEMVDIVAKALSENWGFGSQIRSMNKIPEEEITTSSSTAITKTLMSPATSDEQTTTGVGGSWTPPTEPAEENTYQPSKSGTWGAFPRPRNISVAYGGGKRVGADVKTDEKQRQQSIESTKERLRAYREKMGIDVQSERDHADEIEEALELARRAMQVGNDVALILFIGDEL